MIIETLEATVTAITKPRGGHGPAARLVRPNHSYPMRPGDTAIKTVEKLRKDAELRVLGLEPRTHGLEGQRPPVKRSFLTTDIAARVITGSPWPDGSGEAAEYRYLGDHNGNDEKRT